MRRLIVSGSFIFGLFLIIVVVVSYFQRQQSPPPYWIIFDRANDDQQTIYLATPDGSIEKALIRVNRPQSLQLLDWLSDGQTFLYQTYSNDVGYQLHRYNVRSNQSSHLASALTPTSGPRWQLLAQSPLNPTGWRLILLRSDEGQAIYRISQDGSIFERISPYHSTIDANNTRITVDGEWLLYQASDGGNQPHGLFRQRLDGGEHLELFRFQGSAIVWAPTPNTFNISLFGTAQSESANYEVSIDGDDIHVTETNTSAGLGSTQFASGWTLFYDFDPMNPRSQQLYRQHTDGGEPELVLGEGLRSVVTSYTAEVVIYIEEQGEFEMLKMVDVNTLSHEPLTPDERFTEIWAVRLIDNPHGVVFEAIENDRQAIYRINLDTPNLEQLMRFDHFNTERYQEYTRRGRWILLSDTNNDTSTPHTTMHRLNTNTGEHNPIATFPYDASDIFAINAPDPTIFILSAPNNNTSIAQQVYVNLADGVSKTVNFGRDIKFAAFPSKAVNITALILLGSLMVTSSGIISVLVARGSNASIRTLQNA